MKRVFVFAVTCALGVGCGGSSSGGGGGDVGGDGAIGNDTSSACANISGTWTASEQVLVGDTTCSSAITGIVTNPSFQITQPAGSCDFTLTNSLLPKLSYAGTVSATNAVSWTTTPAGYSEYGGTTTVTAVNVTLSADQKTMAGSFTWTHVSALSNCNGTTTFSDFKKTN